MFRRTDPGAGRRDINCSTRPAGRGVFRHSLMGLSALATMVAFGAPALADQGSSYVKKLNPATIMVKSDGQNYTSLLDAPAGISGEVAVNMNAEESGRIRSWSSWPGLQAYTGELNNVDDYSSFNIQYHGYGDSQSYPVGSRPRSIHYAYPLYIPPTAYRAYVVSACNDLANHLRDAQGLSDQEIFATHRTLNVRVTTHHTWDMSGIAENNTPPAAQGGGSADPQRTRVRIICQKAPSRVPPTVNDPARTEPEVKAVTLAVPEKGGYIGSCSLNLDGTITTTKANEEVRFRYVDDKGHQSDVKVVQADHSKVVIFNHKFHLQSDGKQSGRVRIEGVSSNFASAWQNYELSCSSPNDLQTLLPPKATHLEANTTGDEIRYQGHACPEKVKVFGVFKGRGPSSGNAWLAIEGKPEAQLPFDIEDGQTKVVEAEYELSWEGVRGPFRQDIDLALFLTNPGGAEVSRLLKTQSFSCRKPQISEAAQGGADGLASAPAPKSVVLSTFGLGQQRLPGYVCPERVWIRSSVQSGNQPLKGTVALFAGGSLRKEFAVDQPSNTNSVYDINHDLSWNGATLPEQTMLVTVKFANQHGNVVKTVERTESFACRAVGAVPGGKSTGASEQAQSRQAGNPAVIGKATLLPGAGFAIQAPKGRVRQGKIKLSGGKPNAKYALRFYRKTESGFMRVRSAKLPRQMTGTAASFDLKALSGSRVWRLEVCPAGSKSRKACESSDFRVPRLKGAGKVQPPANPAIAKVFLMPGLGG